MLPGRWPNSRDEQPGDAIAGVVAVVMQEAASQRPPLVLGERDHRVRAWHGRDGECAVAVTACPGEEVPDLVTAGRAGQQVGVEIGLTAGGQVQAAAGKPAGEVDGGLEPGGLAVADPGGQRCLAGFGAGVAQQSPGGVAAQQPAHVRVRCVVQDGGDVAFEAGQVGVPLGEGAQGGEQRGNVVGGVAVHVRDGVERGMRQVQFAAGQPGEDLVSWPAGLEPADHGLGPFSRQQRLMQWLQPPGCARGLGAEQPGQPGLQHAPGAASLVVQPVLVAAVAADRPGRAARAPGAQVLRGAAAGSRRRCWPQPGQLPLARIAAR